MSNEAALKILEPKLEDMERNANALRHVINDLRKEDGLPPLLPGGTGGGGSSSASNGSGAGTLMSIKSDTFFNKKMQTATREYLNMRRASTGDGPATPREIYDAITAGGYQFEAKDEAIALVGLRALLRKRTAFFIKMPNGKYGLKEWYPETRKPKATGVAPDDEVEDDEEEDEIVVEAAPAPKRKAAGGVFE